MTLTVHGTAVCINGAAVLIRGPSGSGKSDVALQLIEASSSACPVQLIADDQTEIELVETILKVRAPKTIRGLLEVRGFGIIPVPIVEEAPLALVVDLYPADQIERLPTHEQTHEVILGQTVPRISVDPLRPSAAARIRFAVQHLKNI
jgi:HPr kinase/phosphorylase